MLMESLGVLTFSLLTAAISLGTQSLRSHKVAEALTNECLRNQSLRSHEVA